MEQVRIHGRGGQGVVTAAELLAMAAFYEGYQAQAFPNFGVERSGAPIQAFARISRETIITREQVYEPTILIIQDATLISHPEIFLGCTKQTTVIINSSTDHWPELHKRFPKLYFTAATKIALEIFGQNIVNTVILGAVAKYTKLISLKSLEQAIQEKFQAKGSDIIAKNILAIKRDYQETV
jgi:pyruvate ferredoxin oxidoreductase gamma subunit